MATTVMTYDDRTANQQLVTGSGGNVVVQDSDPHPATRYKKIFTGLGITQVTIGLLGIILGGVSMSSSAVGYTYLYTGYGLWGGGWYITAGALAIATGARPNNCNVIGGMVVAILASLVAFGAIWYETSLALVDQIVFCGLNNDCKGNNAFSAIHSTIACLSFVEFVISIVHASFCCCGCGGCCGNKSQGAVLTTTTVMTVPNMPPQFPMQQAGYAYPQQGYPQQAYQPQQAQMMAPGHSNPTYSHYEGQQQQMSQPPAYGQEKQAAQI